MYKYNPFTKLSELLPGIRQDIVKELNNNESWRILANNYVNTYELHDVWPINEKENTADPAESFLRLLDEHECDIEVFCMFLEQCHLHDALMILRNPEPLLIVTQPTVTNNDFIYVELGPLNLNCKAEGFPPPQYQWFHETNALNNGPCGELNIDLESASQEGKYTCKVYQLNKKNEVISEVYSHAVFIKIKNTPISICKQPPEFLEMTQDQTLFLDCAAIGHPPPSYQWYKDGKRLNNHSTKKLIDHKFSPSKEGRYQCWITNGLEKVCTRSSLVMSYTERETASMKVALLMANQNYKYNTPLKRPTYEASEVAKVLKNLGFYVICLSDLTLLQMKNAVDKFCEFLVEGAYGFCYYGGHGTQTHYKYMWPVDVPVDYKDSDLLCENWLLAKCLPKNPALLVVVLDMCLKLPSLEDIPESPQLHEYKSNRNLVLAYSTSNYHPSFEPVASEKYEGYSSILCTYLSQDLPVNKLFELIGKAFQEKMKGIKKARQIPMFSSSVVKPYRLTDQILCDRKQQKMQDNLKNLLHLPRTCNFSFTDANISFKIEISSFIELSFNLLQLRVFDLDEKFRIEYDQFEQLDYNYITTPSSEKCVIQCPRTVSGTILINLFEKNKRNSLAAFALRLSTVIPLLEQFYKNRIVDSTVSSERDCT